MMRVVGNPLIAPSLLAADFSRLGEEIKAVDRAGADWIHIDVMDGHFVPNLTLGPPVIAKLRHHSNITFDVHLVMDNPDNYLVQVAKAGGDNITVHAEKKLKKFSSVDAQWQDGDLRPDIENILKTIRTLDKKAGLAINPSTPINAIAHLLPLTDIVLIMTVEPGFGGQTFMESQLEKIGQLRRMIEGGAYTVHIEVDGGVTIDNAQQIVAAGADILVAGTTVFSSDSYTQAISSMANTHASKSPAISRAL